MMIDKDARINPLRDEVFAEKVRRADEARTEKSQEAPAHGALKTLSMVSTRKRSKVRRPATAGLK